MATILVADDDAVMLGLIRTLMELEGNEVITVTRPEDIIPAVRAQPPHLILMDYHLAGGSSVEALKELKGDQDLKHIPVLVTSGMDREVECRQAGADDFILKPFRPGELLSTLAALTGDKAAQQHPEAP